MKKEDKLKLIQISISSALQSFCQFKLLREHLRQLPQSDGRALLAIGKDAGRMADAALDVLTINKGKALALTKYAHYQSQDPRVIFMEAGHPVPDKNSIQHSRRILKWLQELPLESELIVLLSGGGSALFEVPKRHYTLEDIIQMNQKLLKSGMDIREMNKIRADVSEVKAGGAARYFMGKKIMVYALSDVEDDDPEVICSGPFTKEGVSYELIGNNFGFRQLLKDELVKRGFEVDNITAFESKDVASYLKKMQEILALKKQKESPSLMLFGGEIPIQVSGSGQGGRCTHLALSMAQMLKRHKDAIFLAFATDGSDNLSEVAGAWVDANSVGNLKDKGVDVQSALKDSDSFTALEKIGQIIPRGEYHANVNDVYILVW